MRIETDINDTQAVYREILRAPKGIDSPFYLAGSWRLDPKEQRRLQRRLQKRAKTAAYPYALHWMSGPICVGWWETPAGESEVQILHRKLIDESAERNIYPESRPDAR
jgi:hypothetical protein